MLTARTRRGRLISGGIGLLTLVVLNGCVDSAGTGASSATLPTLVQTSFVTLAPSPTTTSTTTPVVSPTAAPVIGAVTPTPSVASEAPVAGSGTQSSAVATTAAPSTGATAGPDAETYTVVANDTVVGIARRHGLSASALATFNGWSDGISHAIHPGDAVKVPPGSATSSSSAPTTTVKSTGSGASTTTSVAAGSGTPYVVVAGDYLTSIARAHGTTAKAIATANGWSDGINHLIVPGQTITLPPPTG